MNSKNYNQYLEEVKQKKVLDASIVKTILERTHDVLKAEPNVLRLSAPISIVGNVAG